MIMQLQRKQRGLTLVELLIAITLAMLVMLGLVTVVNTVGVTNRTQDGLARMQENGRYAIDRIAQDIRAASSQYCSGFSAAASELAVGGYSYTDRTRPAIAHFYLNGTANNYVPPAPNPTSPLQIGPGTGSTVPTVNYLVNPRYMLYGSECSDSACLPALTGVDRGFDPSVVATMGIANGNRARAGDVLTLRYLQGEGVPVTAVTQYQADTLPVLIATNTTQLGAASGDPVWVTDCSVAEILKVSVGANLLTAAGNFNDDTMNRVDTARDARAFNVKRDLMRVSYFLRVNDDTDPGRLPADRKIVSLIRSESGNVQEIVQGVERLDFLYAVEDSQGRTRYLNATEVDALDDSGECPQAPAVPFGYQAWYWQGGAGPWNPNSREAGCGWRAVRGIEVSMLLNTVTDAAVTNDEQFRYAWLNDGTANTASTFERPAVLGTLRNGLPPYRMMRREFRTLVSLRGYNY